MFRVETNREVSWPVTIDVPVDGGKTEPCLITVRYRLLPQADLDELLEQRDDFVFLPKVICGWEDVGDADGVPLPFTEENLNRFLQIGYARAGLARGFFQAHVGAVEKN